MAPPHQSGAFPCKFVNQILCQLLCEPSHEPHEAGMSRSHRTPEAGARTAAALSARDRPAVAGGGIDDAGRCVLRLSSGGERWARSQPPQIAATAPGISPGTANLLRAA